MQQEDIEFLSELSAAQQLRPNAASKILLWCIALFFGWFVLWASFSQVDERVRGVGRVMPSGDIQVVQSLEGGILTEILVSEGTHVKKDQILLRIDDIQFASEGRGIEAQMMSLKAKQSRLKAESSGLDFVPDTGIAKKYPDIAANEESLYRSRQQELKTSLAIIEDEVHEVRANLSEVQSSISKLGKSKSLLQKELDITSRLVAQRAQPEIEKIRLERELNEVSGNLSSAYQSAQSLEAKLSGAGRREAEKRGAFKSQALSELNDVESKIAAISESLKSVEDKVRRTELRSPVEGTVHKLYVKTVGGVIQPAQKLVEVVPEHDDLLVRAKINPADIAFLKPGQPVRVSITAYDPQIYGYLNGKLERIGVDTVEDNQGNAYFEVDVRTESSLQDTGGNALPIAAGMVSEAEVIVGKRSIMTYLLKPVLRAKDRALTEK